MATSVGRSRAGPPTCIISGDRKRVTSVFTDGSEMVEEFDVITDTLVLRKTRTPAALGGLGDWTVEIGAEAMHRSRNPEKELLVESNGSPEVFMQDDKEYFVYRIRNLPYPSEVYSVSLERRQPSASSPSQTHSGDSLSEIVVRTSNKKYFKRLDIVEMRRQRLAMDPSSLSWEHKNNTLIIRYRKPLAILTSEAIARKERDALPTTREKPSDEKACAPQ